MTKINITHAENVIKENHRYKEVNKRIDNNFFLIKKEELANNRIKMDNERQNS